MNARRDLPGRSGLDMGRLLDALAAHGVPVSASPPVPVAEVAPACGDPLPAGAPLYAAVPGGRVFPGAALQELAPSRRRGVYFALAETLARLHRVDWAAAGLADHAGPGSFFVREVARWNGQLAAPRARPGQPGLARVGHWLAAHVPDDDDRVILHGDVRLGNLIFDASGQRVLALCGWRHCALGHPLADAAHSCLPWQLAPESGGIRGLDLARQGIPEQAEYLTHYRLCGGHAEGVTTFHLVFALFRAALATDAGNAGRGAALVGRALDLIDGASP